MINKSICKLNAVLQVSLLQRVICSFDNSYPSVIFSLNILRRITKAVLYREICLLKLSERAYFRKEINCRIQENGRVIQLRNKQILRRYAYSRKL